MEGRGGSGDAWRALALASVLGALAACGGGGGGGGSNPAGQQTVEAASPPAAPAAPAESLPVSVSLVSPLGVANDIFEGDEHKRLKLEVEAKGDLRALNGRSIFWPVTLDVQP